MLKTSLKVLKTFGHIETVENPAVENNNLLKTQTPENPKIISYKFQIILPQATVLPSQAVLHYNPRVVVTIRDI
jgi:hypothetical protein